MAGGAREERIRADYRSSKAGSAAGNTLMLSREIQPIGLRQELGSSYKPLVR